MTMTRQHFQLIADVIRGATLTNDARTALINDFAFQLHRTNPNFNADRFRDAATPTYAIVEN